MTASASDEAPEILIAITRFLDHLRFERRLSPTTLAGRSRDLAAFHSWCDTVQIHALTRIDVQAVRSYAARMRRDGRAAPTLERHLSSLRAWFAF
ncbi:MAG: site-specific integrase [Panacagrimonas sp.]